MHSLQTFSIESRHNWHEFRTIFHGFTECNEESIWKSYIIKQSVYSEMHSKPNIAVSINNNTRIECSLRIRKGMIFELMHTAT